MLTNQPMRKAAAYHVPVMLEESLAGLNLRAGGTYVDVTFGGGGHSRAILERIGREGRLFSFDQDSDALLGVPEDGRLTFVQSNFRWLGRWMDYYGVEQVDGLLADLGVSSHHFDTEERGFSFRAEAPLDMRMNRRAAMTAAQVVATYPPEKLAQVFRLYGELKQAGRLAQCLVRARQQREINTTGALLEAIAPVISAERGKKELAQVFQALRIEVNDEMGALRAMLREAIHLLRPGGRLVVMSYHSLEDRMVKNFIRSGAEEGEVRKDFYGNSLSPLQPVGRVATASREEQERNPRSRSAKLRVAEKKDI